MPHVVSLREAPHKMAMLETKMRYDVLLNGEYWGDLYFNTRGYCGYLPLPGGKRFDPGEISLSNFKKEIQKINKEAKG